MDFKERLAAAIDLSGCSRAQLASALSVSQQAVGMVLTGASRSLTAENTAKAARFLEVDWYWLATGEGEPRPALLKERAALSVQAVEFAAAFDRLDERERGIWQSLVEAAKAVGAAQTAPGFFEQATETHGLKRRKSIRKNA